MEMVKEELVRDMGDTRLGVGHLVVLAQFLEKGVIEMVSPGND